MEHATERHFLITRLLLEFPYSSTPLSVIDAALDLINFKPGEVFADLGCGDGAVLIRTADRFGVFSVGFEIDRNMVNIAWENVRAAGLSNLVDVIHADLFTVDVSKFNVVYIYPSPMSIEKLSQKILNECHRGSRVLVHDYPLEGINQAKVVCIRGGDFHTHKIFLHEL